MRSLFVSILLFASLLAVPAHALWLPEADQKTVGQIETYLNSIKTLKSHFLQATSQGGFTEGTLYISRPGKLRFIYDNAPFQLIADGTWLIYEDTELDQVSYLPLDSTPAAVLVDDKIKLDGDKLKLTSFNRKRGLLVVGLVQTGNPDAGAVSLVFNENPIFLRQWEIVDPQGLHTVVTLENPQTGIEIDDKLFKYKDKRHEFHPGQD